MNKPRMIQDEGGDRSVDATSLLHLMQEVFSKGASFRFTARGWSMAPFIKDGDVVTIDPITVKQPALGSVVAYIQPSTNRLVIHRMIGKRAEMFTIQADNSFGISRESVTDGDILGCVSRVERNGRRVYLGLGIERYLVVIFARNGKLPAALERLRAVKNWLR